MFLHVSPESRLKCLHTEHGPNHLHDGSAFAITDGIEDLLHLLGVLDGNLDGMRGPQRVETHGGGEMAGGELIPHAPIGVDDVGCPIFGPGCEAFVEPEIVPPGHGDEVSEPLVGQFVRDYGADALFLVGGCFGGVDEEIYFAVGDETPVLHCSHCKLWNGNHIQLRQRIRNPKKIIIRIQTLGGTIQGKQTALRFARRSIHPHQHTMLGLRLNVIEFSYAKGHEVSAHDGSVEESNFLELPAREGFVGKFGHVREGVEVFGHGESDAEDGFAGWFVPAGESSSGIQTLELGRSHKLGLPVNIRVLAPIKPSHLIVQKSSILNSQNQRCLRRNRVAKHKSHGVHLVIHANLLCLECGAFGGFLSVRLDDDVRGAGEAQFFGVKGDFAAFFSVGGGVVEIGSCGELDRAFASESEVFEVRGEFEVVAGGVDGGGEEDAACGFVGRGGCHDCNQGLILLSVSLQRG
mmetsp:Transcript_8920/g.17992  ORF Transcript_8920/g.17992 Transcript_8920/m.17992 type:complete len:464 (-) Transcript_8920:76-1467(-)